jgi:hypothetical protein
VLSENATEFLKKLLQQLVIKAVQNSWTRPTRGSPAPSDGRSIEMVKVASHQCIETNKRIKKIGNKL